MIDSITRDSRIMRRQRHSLEQEMVGCHQATYVLARGWARGSGTNRSVTAQRNAA